MGLILLIVLLVLLFGGYSYRGDYGYAPSGVVGLILLVLLILLLMGRVPIGF